jgi:hypothetical protein
VDAVTFSRREREAADQGAARRKRKRISNADFFPKKGSLVDPASSHMLVSKIKPCMSQCKLN